MKTLKDFIRQIPNYSDKELMEASIYDAALFSDAEIGFNILFNKIISEIIQRGLSVDRAISTKKLVKKCMRHDSERRKRLFKEFRRMAATGPIIWSAPTFDDLMRISAGLNDYDSEDFDPTSAPKTDPMLPMGYLWGQDGDLVHKKENGEYETVYPGKIGIRRILVDRNNDSDNPQKAEVSFKCDGQEKIRKMTLKELFNSSSVQSLANDGAFVNDGNSKLIAKFFFDYMMTFRSSIDRCYTTQQIGWQDNTFKEFVPYTSENEYDSIEYKTEYEAILQSMGTYREWASLINQYRDENHIPFRIILASSFASVLAEPLMHQPFFLYIQGRSQFGKTPSLMVVASAWANPDKRSAYIKDLAGSDEALELGAQFYGSLPYCLNESQNRVAQEKNPSIDRLVYLLGDGTPKTRGKSAGGLRSQASWCNAIILTGEEALTSKSDKLGVRMRVFDLNVEDDIISKDDKETESLCEAISFNYNTAGPEFVKRLMQEGGMNKARILYDEYRKAIPSSVERRQNHIAALILTADMLLSKWIFEDSVRLTVEDIMPYLKVKPVERQEQDNEAVQALIDEWLRAEIGGDFRKQSNLGRVIKGTNIFVVFDDKTFTQLLTENGYVVEGYCKWAHENGKLADNEKHGFKRTVKKAKNDPNHSGHLYALVLPSLL